MRDYFNFDSYVNELISDVYPQPIDDGHLSLAVDVINKWIPTLVECNSVLDVGCGQGFCQSIFESLGISYEGISLGNDVKIAQEHGRNVIEMDFTFLSYLNNHVDLIFARHSLEHSIFPLISLMEWHRVSRKYLCVIIPNPEYFTYVGRNHYSVMTSHQMVWLLRRAGWKLIKHELLEQEFRFLCEKRTRISYEGYVEAPLNQKVHDFEHTEFLGGR